MVKAVVDVRSVRVLQALLECFPGCLRSVFAGAILRTFRLVKNSRLSFHSKVFAQLIEPFKNGAVARERPKPDFIEGLLEA